MIPGAATQVRALLSLRWEMVRTPGLRLGLGLVALGVAYLLVEVARLTGHGLEPAALETARRLAPQAYLGFGVLAVVAPLTAGGGNDVIPSQELVAFPVRSRTLFVGGLLLAPVNLVWVLQIFALVAETAFLTQGGHAWPGALTTTAYIAATTVLGQGVAWAVAGLRQSRRGRQCAATLSAAVLATAVLVVKGGAGPAVLDASPTHSVVRGVVAGAQARWSAWALPTAVLLLLLAGGLLAGARACAWSLRRPGDGGASTDARVLRRRAPRTSALQALLALDRASAWRAPAARRGALVLAVLPGVIAAGAAVPWESLIVLPGLVAAGAGLLFGVNAFCLDSSGAVWLASLPHDPALLFRSKLQVVAEVVGVGVLVAVVAGSSRSAGLPSRAIVVGIVVSGVVCTALTAATCMSLSVRHPHRAELRGPRDAVAPPGALALASARLALPAGAVGIVLESASRTGLWWLPVLVALPVLALAAVSLRRSARRWGDPLVRSRVVQVVSAG